MNTLLQILVQSSAKARQHSDAEAIRQREALAQKTKEISRRNDLLEEEATTRLFMMDPESVETK
ncbi:unnamed protein product, partial [Aphanomyces euteiches]